MGNVLVIEFEEFKELAKDRRVYYYETEDYLDVHFLFEGMIIKSRVFKSSISNVQMFVSDKLFYGALKLDFNIPLPEDNDVIKKSFVEVPDIDDIQDEEIKNEDIQIEGVEE